MSQHETNEIINPTHDFNLPLQPINEETNSSTKVLSNTNTIPSTSIMKNPTNIQMNPKTFAEKQRILHHIKFNVANPAGTNLMNIEFTPNMLKKFYNQLGAFKFRNHNIEVNLKPTNNAMFQGLFRVFFDPAPHNDYYSLFGNSLSNARSFQLPGTNISGNSADVIKTFIPKIYPFNYFVNDFSSNPVEQAYLDDYPMGRLRARVIVPLMTTSTIVEMPTFVTISLPDLVYGGTDGPT